MQGGNSPFKLSIDESFESDYIPIIEQKGMKEKIQTLKI